MRKRHLRSENEGVMSANQHQSVPRGARPRSARLTNVNLAHLDLPAGGFTLREAEASDVGSIIALLADDDLRAYMESLAPEDRGPYDLAFAAIDADAAQLLVVAVGREGDVVATMQLTFLPGLARAGATRLQIEAVRVGFDLRGNGLGAAMIAWAITEGRRRGARLVQLTSDGSRSDAHRFYQRLGFEASHVGFKLAL